MAPVLIRRVLDSSIWSTLDASQPKLSRRYTYIGVTPAVVVIPIAIFAFFMVIGCCVRAQRLSVAKQRNAARAVSRPRDHSAPRTATRPQAASVPPAVFEDILDPPPPYVPLQTLRPAHKPVDGTLQRPADTERTVGNHGQVRSMLEV
jgi:hypothetical protein